MKNFKKYAFEYVLVFLTVMLTLTAFLDIYFRSSRKADTRYVCLRSRPTS